MLFLMLPLIAMGLNEGSLAEITGQLGKFLNLFCSYCIGFEI